MRVKTKQVKIPSVNPFLVPSNLARSPRNKSPVSTLGGFYFSDGLSYVTYSSSLQWPMPAISFRSCIISWSLLV